MEEDEDIYEMFLKIMEQLHAENPDGRMRVISKNPRHAVDDPDTQKTKSKLKER